MTVTESDEFTEITGAMDLPCELDRPGVKECDHPAAWVMWTKDHGCGPKIRLACEACKDARMTSEEGVLCPDCKNLTKPARRAYVRIEPLS